jgi:type I restriction enzyme, S subunit
MSTDSTVIPVGYKQTEVGVVPKDWRIRKVGDFTNCAAGGTPSTLRSDYWGEGFRWMNSGELNLKIVNDVEGRITPLGLKESSTRLIPPKCILIGLAGQGKTRGTVATNTIELCTNQSIAAIFPNNDFFSKWLYYNLDNRYLELRGMSTGDSGRGSLNLTIIRSIYVAFPNYKEQELIAKLLTVSDSQIQALEDLITKKRGIKQGTMQELLTRKTRLPGFSGDWCVKTLEEITICLDNLRVPLNERQRKKMKGIYPYCGANGIVDYIDEYVIDDDIILMAEDGGYFDQYAFRPIAYRITGKCWVNNHAHILKNRSGFDLGFIFYSLVNKNILRYIASGTRAKLNKSEMNKIEVNVPIYESEQKAIAEVLSDMDAEIAALEERLEKAKAIKQGMMQQLLTGKIRLVD